MNRRESATGVHRRDMGPRSTPALALIRAPLPIMRRQAKPVWPVSVVEGGSRTSNCGSSVTALRFEDVALSLGRTNFDPHRHLRLAENKRRHRSRQTRLLFRSFLQAINGTVHR